MGREDRQDLRVQGGPVPVVELQVDWVNGEVDASLDEIVEHFTRMFTAVAYAAVEDRPGRTPGKGK